ncbi:DnaB-like helicase N-terminal domain-containing protein [Vibrio parahaemolyticus]|nr:DnaB-like helicase N-terminal domain-containing protein [Vibrio parahaemolyticus]
MTNNVNMTKDRMMQRKRRALPPHSLEAEVNLLSGLLYNKAARATLSSQLHRDLFYGQLHREVFDALASLFTSHHDVTFQMLSAELRKRNSDVQNYQLQELELYKINAANTIRFAEIVIERYQQREAWFAESEASLSD